jgi:uncharacterized membrane protein
MAGAEEYCRLAGVTGVCAVLCAAGLREEATNQMIATAITTIITPAITWIFKFWRVLAERRLDFAERFLLDMMITSPWRGMIVVADFFDCITHGQISRDIPAQKSSVPGWYNPISKQNGGTE